MLLDPTRKMINISGRTPSEIVLRRTALLVKIDKASPCKCGVERVID